MQPPRDHVIRPDIVMRRHDEMRQQRLGDIWLALWRIRRSRQRRARARSCPARDRRAYRSAPPRRFGPPIGQIDDLALAGPLDCRVRLSTKLCQPLRKPVIAPRLAAVAVHALLDDDPFAVVGDDEAVQIEVEPILHRRAVDLGDEPACLGQRRAVEADLLTDGDEFLRRLPRMVAASAADVNAELARQAASARASAHR